MLGRPATLVSIHTAELTGGFAPAAVFRHDLTFHLDEGGRTTVRLVHKSTSPYEVRVMRTVSTVPGAAAVPSLIDADATPEAGWFVVSYYDGPALTWDDEVPSEVVDSLARVHVHFASRRDELGWLVRVDGTWLAEMVRRAVGSLAPVRSSAPAYREAYRLVCRAGKRESLFRALAALPLTLVHGDMHPGNVVRAAGGGVGLLDWGNARLAPPTLDLANLVELDSPPWARYLATWAGQSGEALSGDLARRGYHWAKATINLMYLPHVVCTGSADKVLAMAGQAWAAVQSLE